MAPGGTISRRLWVGTKQKSVGVAGVMLLVSAPLFFALPSMFPREVPAGDAIEGTVADPAVDTPVGEPVTVGRVEVRDGDEVLYEEVLGGSSLTLQTAGGEVTVTVPKESSETWKRCRVTRYDVAGSPLASQPELAGREGLRAAIRGVAEGDPVVVAADGSALWCGTREAVVAVEDDRVAKTRWMGFGAGGGMLLFGFLVTGVGWSAVRHLRASQPAEDAAAEAWVAWILSQRGGTWLGAEAGRKIVAERSTRESGRGPAQLRMACDVDTQVTVLRRGGKVARIGRAIEALAGQDAVEGELFGLDGLEVIAHDRAWAEAWLGDEVVNVAIRALFVDDADATGVNFSLVPGHITLILPNAGDVDPARARRWLDAFTELARTAEEAPPPTTPRERGRLHELAMDPARARRVAWLVMIGFIVVFSVGYVAILLGLLWGLG